ncbi:hypothetical protein LINGRAHAP2_LOCUS18837 [Linum grandiflorum]
MMQQTLWQWIQLYKLPILEITLSMTLTLLSSTLLKFPILLLHGLHTYIQPDVNPSTTTAAIRRPSAEADPPPKRKSKQSKDNKFEFDENQAQIFRLKLDSAHLQSRLYFKDYWYSFTYSLIALSCLFLHKYFEQGDEEQVEGKKLGAFANGSLIPGVLILVALFKVFGSLGKASFERSASKKSEKRLGFVMGVLGFVIGLLICSSRFTTSVLDFELGSLRIDGYGKFFVSLMMGCIAGFLYMGAGKNARSFWIGTDQTRSNMAIMSCGWFGRTILYANYIAVTLAALLWIHPLAEIFYSTGNADAENLVGRSLGFRRSEFVNIRMWTLLGSGVVQIVALRPNLQMFLNEAVLSWYQRLHASRVPELDYSRAKVFLHNHYLCLAALQFFAVPVLVFLFLGLSRIDGSVRDVMCGSLLMMPCTAFTGEVAVFMAWWVVFVWTAFTSASLMFYRRGTLYVS